VIDISLIALFNPARANHLPTSFVSRTSVGSLVGLRVILLVFFLVISSHRKRLSATSCGSLRVSAHTKTNEPF